MLELTKFFLGGGGCVNLLEKPMFDNSDVQKAKIQQIDLTQFD